ncbi:MAG: DUF1573 domain-containing protein [Planctomycetes bacterium]|nr:DUF1573 domain-containing protein [Planctomycetota bacterium]
MKKKHPSDPGTFRLLLGPAGRVLRHWRLHGPAILAGIVLAMSSARADLRFPESTIDLADIRAGVRLTREVALINDSAAALEIVEVRGSCGCVSPRIEPRVIPPGGRATLHLSINTLGEGAGPHAWKVAIFHRRQRMGDDVKASELSIRARIVTEITIQPASVTMITAGGLTQTVLLTDLRAEPMKVKQVAASAAFLKAKIVERGDQPRTTKILLEVGRELPPGRHVETLTIYADDPIYGELRVPVTIVRPAAGAVSIDPPEVCLDPAADITSQMVRIRARDGQPVHIEKVLPAHVAIRCKWAAAEAGDMFLKIEADAVPVGVSRSRVEVHLSTPARAVLAIPVLIGAGDHETPAGSGFPRGNMR